MIVLAPMEGLLDYVLRDVLTRIGGIDRCIAEFIRVTNTLLPERVFMRVIPELAHGSCTPAGTPVRGQLLGSDPICMADNAARLASLGPFGVDLNFGCPAKIVNRHGGGATLLQNPESLYRIVHAVRQAVEPDKTVSAKMRLGFNDDSLALECALAIEAGGASEITVHARTKAQAYRPPAYWSRIADIRSVVKIPLIANGEIWNTADALQARTASGCDHLMLGRGIVTAPGLAIALQQLDTNTLTNTRTNIAPNSPPSALQGHLSWADLQPHLHHFWQVVTSTLTRRQKAGRLKQWLHFLRRHYPQAEAAYQALKGVTEPEVIHDWFKTQALSEALALARDEQPVFL